MAGSGRARMTPMIDAMSAVPIPPITNAAIRSHASPVGWLRTLRNGASVLRGIQSTNLLVCWTLMANSPMMAATARAEGRYRADRYRADTSLTFMAAVATVTAMSGNATIKYRTWVLPPPDTCLAIITQLTVKVSSRANHGQGSSLRPGGFW